MKTAIDYLLNSLPERYRNAMLNTCQEEIKQAKEKEKGYMIGFYRWMLKHDTADNAEAYFHYTDEDMVEEYLKEVGTQDLAICEYSGLRSVEGYKEKKTDEEVMREGEITRMKMYEYDENIEKKLNERMDIIGQNGNEGIHYDK